jgi:hypothetical protein
MTQTRHLSTGRSGLSGEQHPRGSRSSRSARHLLVGFSTADDLPAGLAHRAEGVLTDASWYDSGQHDANSVADLDALFGPPSVSYQVGGHRVLLWRQNLLTHVNTVTWCGYPWVWSTRAKPSATPCR